MLHVPPVGDQVAERVSTFGPGWVVRMGTTIGDDRVGCAHALKTVPHFRRYDDQRIIVRAQEKFHRLTFGWRTFSIVIQDKFYATLNASVVQRHLPMLVPALDDAGINCREVDFSELAEMRVGAFEHVKDGSAFVGDAL